MKPIPIAKPLLGEDEKRALAEVVESGTIASGPRVAAFEAAFARYVGVEHAVATSNGTTGLHAAFAALGLGPGDEVVVPAFTFIATANTVLFAGATPVFADIDPDTFTLDPDAVESVLTDRTRAIVPVHLYGQAADMRALQEVADRHDLRIVGDAAQAHGAALGRTRVGAFGDCEVFSFYPTKNMTTGEGGIVTTDDAEVADRLRSFVNHGRAKSELGTYDHVRPGHNFRMTDLHAAIGLVQLGKLDGWNARRQENAQQLTRTLAEANVETPIVREDATHVFHQYTIRTPTRAAMMERLKADGIGYGVYYPKALHQYAHLARYARGALPESERAAREALSLPVHPAVSHEDVERIARAVGGKA